jgi:hypothetical protein
LGFFGANIGKLKGQNIMILTEENLSDLTARVKGAYKKRHRKKVDDSWVLSQLQNIDGMPFIRISRHYTLSNRDECLALKSYGSPLKDGIAIFNAL